MKLKRSLQSVIVIVGILTNLIHPLIVSGDMIEAEEPEEVIIIEPIEVILSEEAIESKLESILRAEEEQPIQVYPIDIYPCVWGEISLSLADFELLCITVWCESGNQDLYTQTLVAKTLLNRIASDLFPDNLTDVVYQKGQYSVTQWQGFPDAFKDKVTEQAERACFEAITTDNAPYDLYYFRNDYYHKGGIPYYNNGVLYFTTQGR